MSELKRLTLPSTLVGLITLAACSGLKEPGFDFNTPPGAGSMLQPQPGLVLCRTPQAAATMALTGFFLPGCATLTQRNRYRVVDIALEDRGAGQQYWLVEIEDTHAGDSNRYWATFPWHDWA